MERVVQYALAIDVDKLEQRDAERRAIPEPSLRPPAERNFRSFGALQRTDTGVNPQQDPDVQLMLAVQRDSREAFDTLFRKYIGPVVAFASSYVGSRARAEELAQDAFVQLYRARHQYEPRARFKTFLYRIVTNVCLSDVRRSHHRQRAGEMPLLDPGADAAESDARTGEEDLALRQDVDRMRQAVLELPPQQRAALLLARVEGLSYEEVARSLACSVSAVKSLIHRATVSLREQLRDGR